MLIECLNLNLAMMSVCTFVNAVKSMRNSSLPPLSPLPSPPHPPRPRGSCDTCFCFLLCGIRVALDDGCKGHVADDHALLRQPVALREPTRKRWRSRGSCVGRSTRCASGVCLVTGWLFIHCYSMSLSFGRVRLGGTVSLFMKYFPQQK